MTNHKPVLLLGFPRGFTSQVYKIVQRATKLREVLGVAGDGEVLNLHRALNDLFQRRDLGNLSIEPLYDESDHGYEWVCRLLDNLQRSGSSQFIIKDVSQPFHVLRYIQEHPNRFNVIYVKRNLDEVKFSISWRRWTYVHSIDRLAREFDRFPSIDVSLTISDSNYLFDRLEEILGCDVERFEYIDDKFRETSRRFFEAFYKGQGTADLEMVEGRPKLVFDRDYNVGYGEQGAAALRSGWSGPESGFVWSDGRVSILEFFHSEVASGRVQVTLTAKGYQVDKSGETAIDVYYGDLKCGSFILEDGPDVTFSFVVPATRLVCRVSVNVERPRRPIDHADGVDTRELGIALKRIRIESVP